MERAVAAGKALADDLRVLVDEDGHKNDLAFYLPINCITPQP
jgi:hypothetical protein